LKIWPPENDFSVGRRNDIGSKHDRGGYDPVTLILTAILTAGVTFASGMGALHVQGFLPDSMRSDSCRAVIVQISALLSVLLAMVLGGLVGTSFAFFFAQKANLDTLSAQVLQFDHALAEYGPEASRARAQLKEVVLQGYEVFWSRRQVDPGALTAARPLVQEDTMNALLASLQPTSQAQKQALAKAQQYAAAMEQSRLLLSLQIAGQSVPWQLIVIVAFWAAALFFGYGLFAPNNATIVIALALAAVSIGLAIFLIFDLRQPYTGVFRISPGSLKETIKFLSR
jgi:hypothetical protein